MPPLCNSGVNDARDTKLGTIVVQSSPNKFRSKFYMWRHYFCWDQHFRLWRHNMGIYRKITSCDVKWRHLVGFLPKSQEMFPLWIWSYGANMESFALFKRKLCQFSYFKVNMEIYRKIGKIRSISDENPITFFLDMKFAWNLHRMCKTKL